MHGSKRVVLAFAAKHGHHIDANGNEVLVMAPKGCCYQHDCHERVFSPYNDDPMSDLWRRAAEAVNLGALDPTPCTAATCPSWEGQCAWWGAL